MARNLSPIEPQTGSTKRRPQRAYARQPSPIGVPLPVGRRDAAERRRTRRRPVRWMGLLALLSIGAGAVYWLAASPSITVVHPRRGPAVQAVYATGGIPLFRFGDFHRSAQIVVFEPSEDLSLGDRLPLINIEFDEPRHAVGGNRHHNCRLDCTSRIDRLNRWPPTGMHHGYRG